MSYDFALHETPEPRPCGCCDRRRTTAWVDLGDPTYNYSGMLSFAADVPYWRTEVDGKPIAEAIVVFSKMLVRVFDPKLEAEFQKLAPSNGWGTYEGLRSVVARLVEGIQRIIDEDGLDVFEWADEANMRDYDRDGTEKKRHVPASAFVFRA